MPRKASVLIALLLALFAAHGALAADWKPVGQTGGQAAGKDGAALTIDRSRIGRGGDGLVAVWSRLAMPQATGEMDGRYNAIEALNRYDCAGNRFATLKRLYLLDNVLVRAEPVLLPKEVAVAAGSVDASILAEVCKTSKPAVQTAATENSAFGSGLMSAEAKEGNGLPASLRLVAADAGSATASATGAASATPSAGVRRFITLPRIDPSQVQHPTDEAAKPAEAAKPTAAEAAKNADPAALKREAAKAGISLDASLTGMDRHAREVALATSGPRKAAPKRAVASRPQGEETPTVAPRKDVHWSYEGEGAPANWAALREDYGLCESGKRQSPIDIREGIRVDLEPIKFDYRPSQFRIVDNGHTVQVNFGEGNAMTVMGRSWRLVQLHFHRPSEERIDGRGFEMVMHLVHRDDEGRLAVVAVLIERGAEHPVIQTFWNNLPLETDAELAPTPAIDPNKLLPEARGYYTYMGSLTTPPCSEGVLWMVMKQPLQLSPEQIAIFSRLYRNNARPIQPSNGRLIKESR